MLTRLNFNIVCHSLATSKVSYYRDANRYTVTFNNCNIEHWHYQIDTSLYIIEPTFIYNALIDDEIH